MLAVITGLGGVSGTASAARPDRTPEQVPDAYIVVLRDSVDAQRTIDRLEQEEGFRSEFRYTKAVKGSAARLDAGQVRRLRSDPDVAYVTPDRVVRISESVPLAAGDSAPTGVRRMGAATVSTTRQASTVRVAVVDTGVDLAHPDLNAVSGVNCVTPGAPAQDDQGHGTHVAGTIAAQNNGVGVVGVAPGTTVVAVKVLGAAGSGTYSQIICGLDWITATRVDADPGNDIAVANMSLGGVGQPVASCATTTDAMHAAICRSTAVGVTYVVAAGNDGWDFDFPSQPDTPAAYPEVITVTAVSDSDGQGGATGGVPTCRTGEQDDRAASFSNYALTAAGQAHTIGAPGVCITSTTRLGGYGLMSGTSMASPHVAGAVALCLGETGVAAVAGPCSGLTPGQITAKLRADAQRYTNAIPTFGFTGDPLRPISNRYYGYLDPVNTDSTAPTVVSMSPAAASVAVSASTAVSVTFSETMDRVSTQGGFTLRRTSDAAAVAGTFSWSASTMTFQPSAALAGNTGYVARVAPGAVDAAGNQLATETSWSFTTGSVALTTLAFPGTTTILSGSLDGGTASRLTADDDSYYAVRSTTSGTLTTDWFGTVIGVNNDLTGLRVSYKGKNSRSCFQSVSVYNWTTLAWVPLDARSVGTTEVLIDRAVGVGGVLADYVSGDVGDGSVRVQVRCTAGSKFTARGDLMRVSVTRS